jgi:hypothetical protein
MILARSLSNSELLRKTKSLVEAERRITLELIECLEVISTRMLYAELGFGSLFEFCTRHLGLSEGSAHRRISAMRLARDVPQVKEQIRSGGLSLSNAAKIQVATSRVLKAAPKAIQQKRKSEIVESCLGLSQSKCETTLLTEFPELREAHLYTERQRQVNQALTELKLVVTSEFNKKLERLLRLVSHTNPHQSIIQLFERLIEKELQQLEKKRGLGANLLSTTPITQTQYQPSYPVAVKQDVMNVAESRSRSIPAATRKLVWSQAQGQCQYPGCGSTYQLEIEHKVPFAKGGTHELQNLTLYCRTHNQLMLRRHFGLRHQKRLLK